MMTGRMAVLILFLLAGSVPAALGSGVELLPEGKHQNLVIANCVACHSARLVVQNRMSRTGWDETITWMQKKHNLWVIPPGTRDRILDYLSTHLGPGTGDSMDGLGPRRVNPLPHLLD